MEKPYLIDIVGIQTINGEEEKIELQTSCSYVNKNNKYYIIYDEYDEDDVSKKTTSTLKVDGESKVTLTKSGNTSTRLILEKDKRHQSLYSTEVGNLIVGISTSRISSSLNEDGGTLKIDYSLDINSDLSSLHHIFIKIRKGANNKNVKNSVASN